MKTIRRTTYAAIGLALATPAAMATWMDPSYWTGDEATSNPYAFENMKCEWYDGEGNKVSGTILFDPDEDFNPYYPKGLCTAPTINLSARTPYTCEAGESSADGVCPGAGTEESIVPGANKSTMVCVDDEEFGQLCLTDTDPEDNQLLDKLLSYYECPGWTGAIENGVLAPADVPAACYSSETPVSELLGPNLDDRSWYMPIDISKAHRGFIDGNFVFMLYAWSPNFKLNAVGRDRYELYTRRSFDGGITWTTTPASFTASNDVAYSGSGTTTCETWRDGVENSQDDSHVCTAYDAGVPEQSRNVTQHKSMKVTTLDPRYSPTGGAVGDPPADYDGWTLFEPIDPTDLRDPSRNFVVFESGDNTTVAVGEAEPLNLDYGRAEVFGDHFTVWSEIDTGYSPSGGDPLDDCYPNNTYGDTAVAFAEGTGFCNEFDTLEGFPDALSEEASITASAYGDFLYGTWGQFNVDDAEEFVDADVMFRRVWWLDEYISETEAYSVGGSEGQLP